MLDIYSILFSHILSMRKYCDHKNINLGFWWLYTFSIFTNSIKKPFLECCICTCVCVHRHPSLAPKQLDRFYLYSVFTDSYPEHDTDSLTFSHFLALKQYVKGLTYFKISCWAYMSVSFTMSCGNSYIKNDFKCTSNIQLNWGPYTSQDVSCEAGNGPKFCYTNLSDTPPNCMFMSSFYCSSLPLSGARGSIVGWGSMLQARMLRVPFLTRYFSIDLILPAALWPWGQPSL
jgi:hypothetical protein